jgi:L-ascorbate metabolism protein UlaG (beta-lactamase superfamily)
MKVTYYGHSCFGVEVAGKHLLFDPFITQNERAYQVDVDQIPADYILVSHGHFDHIDDAARIARRTGATVVGGFEVVQWIKAQGAEKIHPMNHGGSFGFEFGRVKFVVAVHSSTLPDGSAGGTPGGFVVESEEGRFYYSGDTALTMDMQLIAEGRPLRFAALCIGDNFTMGVEDAARAAEFVKCDEVIGVHFDTWPMIAVDHAHAQAVFRGCGKQLHLPAIGETLSL